MVVGSTSRMYQRQVSRSPRSVRATSSSSEPAAPCDLEGQVVDEAGRLAPRRGPPRPGGSAGARAGRPRSSRCGSRGRPLSNTEMSAEDDVTARNGEHSRPGSPGSLRRSKGAGSAARPPGSRRRRSGEDGAAVLGVPTAQLVGQAHHQVGDRLGRQEDLVAAGRAAPAAGPPRPAARPGGPRGPRPTTSAKSVVPAPAQVEPVPSAAAGHQVQGPLRAGRGPAGGRSRCRGTRWSGGARRSRPGRGRTAGPGRRRRTGRSRTPLGQAPTGRWRPAARTAPTPPRACRRPAGPSERTASSAGGDPAASASAARTSSATSTSPPRRATPAAIPRVVLAQADHGDPPVPAAPVGGGGVVGEADLDLAGSPPR